MDSSGNLTVSTGYPKVIPAQPPIVSSFKPGKYVGPGSYDNYFITVAGPGLAPGGATEWSLSTPSASVTCTYPGTATWYVGPLSSNPIAARLSKVGITSTAWSYGVGSSSNCTNGYLWRTDTLIGVSQVGNTITFVSFTYDGTDYPLPKDQITYTLVQ